MLPPDAGEPDAGGCPAAQPTQFAGGAKFFPELRVRLAASQDGGACPVSLAVAEAGVASPVPGTARFDREGSACPVPVAVGAPPALAAAHVGAGDEVGVSCASDFYGYAQDLAHLAGRDVGIALSGGGSRAASAALGELRALHVAIAGQPPFIGRVKYVSSVSGGTWFAVPYTFLSDPKLTDADFLGRPRALSETDADKLDDVEHSAMVAIIDKAYRLERLFGRYYRTSRSEAYGRAVGDVFLGRLGLNDQRRRFSAGFCSAAYLESHGDLSTGPRDRPEKLDMAARIRQHFYLPRADRPFLIANATLLAKGRLARHSGDRLVHPVEITPLYAGIRPIPDRDDCWSFQFGGGYVESMGFGEKVFNVPRCKDAHGEVELRRGTIKQRFTLSDVMGVSGAAPVETLARSLPEAFRSNQIGFPSYNYTPVGSSAWQERSYVFGDGEHLDNLAVTALLARQVQNILAFVNTDRPLCRRDTLRMNGRILRQCATPGGADVLDDLRALFGAMPRKRKSHALCEAQLEPTVEGLANAVRAGGPALYCAKYGVRDNKAFGIKAQLFDREEPYQPTICWLYLEPSAGWFQELNRVPPEGKQGWFEQLMKRASPFADFPHYATLLQEGIQMIDLDPPAINALADLTAWSTEHALPEIARAFAPSTQLSPPPCPDPEP